MRIKTDISQASMQAAASFLPSSLARPQITYIFIILGTLNGRRREDTPLPPRARPLLSPAVAEKERNGGGAEEWEEASAINFPVISVVRWHT